MEWKKPSKKPRVKGHRVCHDELDEGEDEVYVRAPRIKLEELIRHREAKMGREQFPRKFCLKEKVI